MENMLDWGLAFYQESRHQHMTTEVKVGFILDDSISLQATFSGVDASNQQNKVSNQGQYFIFIFRTTDLSSNGIKIQRGLKIWKDDDEYEVVLNDKNQPEYGDPLKKDIVLTAVLKSTTNKIRPEHINLHTNQ